MAQHVCEQLTKVNYTTDVSAAFSAALYVATVNNCHYAHNCT